MQSPRDDNPEELPPLPPMLPLPQLHRNLADKVDADKVDAGNVLCKICKTNFVSHNRYCNTCDNCTNKNGCGCDTNISILSFEKKVGILLGIVFGVVAVLDIIYGAGK